jgi:hypothetical protein
VDTTLDGVLGMVGEADQDLDLEDGVSILCQLCKTYTFSGELRK